MMIVPKGFEYYRLINDNFYYDITPYSWSMGLCTDGDYNSINIKFQIDELEIDKLKSIPSSEFFMFTSKQFLVEKASVSNYYINSSMCDRGRFSAEVDITIHFHSKIIREGVDMDNVLKMLNRVKIINKILDNDKL